MTDRVGQQLGNYRLIHLLGEPPAMPLDVYMVWLDAASFSFAADFARQLRSSGLVVELPPEARKMGKLMEQASKLGARYALIVGEAERASRRYTLKDMISGEQQQLPLDEIEAKLTR